MAELIRAERERRGWSMEHLASVANIEKSTVYRIERGESAPRGETRRKLAEALELPVDRLRTPKSTHAPASAHSADLLRTLRRVWPDLSDEQQIDLLQRALELRRGKRATPAKTAAS